MKTSAVLRIVIYSLLILLLLGILLTGMGAGLLVFNLDAGSGDYATGERSISADGISNLKIEWAAGSVTILSGDTNEITFSESGNLEERYQMVSSESGNTLHIQYAKPAVSIGFVSVPSKDLTITVPKDWFCEELEIDGAALDIDISGLSVAEFDIDGASNELRFTGSVNTVSCDGAACEMELVCNKSPQTIDLDGAACSLDLTIPEGRGFLVQMDGLSCDFDADVDYTSRKDAYTYGDEHCRIDVDGISCEVKIHYSTPEFNSSAVLQDARNIYTSYIAAFDHASGSSPAEYAIIEVDENDLYVIAANGTIHTKIYRSLADAQAALNALHGEEADYPVIRSS